MAKYLRRTASGATGSGLDATIKYVRRTASGAEGSDLGSISKCLCDAEGVGMGTTAKYLRRTTRQRPGQYDLLPVTNNERRRG
jgi:hypothetical protein